ncbi:MAG: hypothetical protein U1C53_00040, partial [Candidatus Veblenbacteria bacterium]|nr:hypothetical protein [Candidatus Veblenbacteria bacterium]
VVMVNVKTLGVNLGIRQFWLGLVLGVLTSMPELTVGVQASLVNVGQLSFGNLMGGVVVLLGLIVGVSVVVDRGLDVAESFRHRELVLIVTYISLPLWFMFDGALTSFEGLVLVLTYGLCVYYLIRTNTSSHPALKLEGGTSNLKVLWLSLLGLVAVVVMAKFILDLSLPLIQQLNIRPFLAGLLFFSLGTNLPELTLAFRSWRGGARDLSFGNLIGSAFANSLVVGLLAFIKPMQLAVGAPYYVFVAVLVGLLVSFVLLAYTGRRLTPREGWVLIGFYALFLFTEIGLRWL